MLSSMRAEPPFHPDFTPTPYWWEAWRPAGGTEEELPRRTRIAVIGAGYAGLAAALELARSGIEAIVLEAGLPGSGASTRNGGAVSGGVNVGKSLTGRRIPLAPERRRALLGAAADAFGLVETLIERENIACFWEKRGRFVGAFTPTHYRALEARLGALNDEAASDARMLPRSRQREEIASGYYYGGMIVGRAAKLHPALYFKGLLGACRRAGVPVVAEAKVMKISHDPTGPKDRAWKLETARGAIEAAEIIIATNGYTGALTPGLRRRLIPVASHTIATEELPADLALSLIPNGRTISDTRRVLTYYRLSPDGRRLIFGGRARFTTAGPRVTAPILHRFMTERFPQLRGIRITHAWSGNAAFTFDALPHMGLADGLHYCLGCNGSGIAMMTFLGTETARRIASGANRARAFGDGDFPGFPFYRGNPWFLPLIGGWFRFRDARDRRRADAEGGNT